jgi:nucleotide-binding universal stress UspA family protein
LSIRAAALAPRPGPAVRWALGEADVRDARVQAVLVWSSPAIALPSLFTRTSRDSTERMEQAARDTLDRVVNAAGGDGVERTTVEGRTASTLVKCASSAALLVVGTRGLGGAGELFLGSTSQDCAIQASVPVVIVPNGFRWR